MCTNIKATWNYSLDVDCQKCKKMLDLTNIDGYDYVSELSLELLEQHTEESTNIEVICPHSEHEFLVDLEY